MVALTPLYRDMDARPIVEERQACGYSRLHRRETIEVYFKGSTEGDRM